MLRLIPDEPILKLNAVAGSGGSPQGEGTHNTDINAELERYANATHTSRFFSANGTTKK
jgi:hypothetical protein